MDTAEDQIDVCHVVGDEDADVSDKDPQDSVGFDSVLRAISTPSMRYHFVQIGLFFTFGVSCAFMLFIYVFIGYEPPHVCAETNETDLLSKYSLSNDTTTRVVYEMCQIRITSNITGNPEDVVSTGCISGHSYEGGKDMTMKTEWDLVCEDEGLAELVQTMFFVGMIIATISVSPIPDRFGRKPVLVVFQIVFAITEIGLTFSPSIYVVIGLKMLSGFLLYHLSKLVYLIVTELLITRHREMYALAVCVSWSFFLVSLGCIAYLLRSYSWRMLQLVSSLTGLLPIVCCYFVDESLSWLFATKRHTRALNLIRNVCKINGADFEAAKNAYNKCCLRLEKNEQRISGGATQTRVSKYGIVDICRRPQLLKTTVILSIALFTVHLTYSGLYLTTATFTVNRFHMFMIMAALELPSSVIFFILLSYTGRRNIFVFSLCVTAVSLFVSACLAGLSSSLSKHGGNASAAFFIIGKFATDISFAVVWAFLVEHYPTTMRSVALGLTSCFGHVGGTISPYLYPLFLKANWAPGTMLGALCLVTACCYLLIPETKGKELPTTIQAVGVPV